MSLKPQAIGPIPQPTIEVAKAAFPKGNTYITMRDEMGVFFSDEPFVHLFSSRGQPALCPWRLALVTIMQYAENLTDRQAADAVAARIDWKYALGLELSNPGFNYSVLSEFRDRLIEGSTEQLLFEMMLSRFKEKSLLKARGKQRTDSTHILAAIKTLNILHSEISQTFLLMGNFYTSFQTFLIYSIPIRISSLPSPPASSEIQPS